MAKALKIASAVVAVAGLAIITGGLAAGASLSFIMSAGFGAGSLTVGGLMAVGAALNTAGSLLSPKPKAPATSEANANRLTVSMVLREFRKTVLGSTAFATDLRDQEWSADQSVLHRFIVCASHRVQAIREIWFDDKLAWTATGGVQAPYVGYLDVTPVLEGSAANAINIGPRMGASRRFTGCAYVYLRYKLTGNGKKAESPFASTIPSRVTIVGDGAFFYDPRLDSTVPGGSGPMRADDQQTWAWNPTFCRNPALGLLFYLLGWRIQNPATGEWKLAIGKGIPASRIDLPSFITAANLCEEPVTRADGTVEPRYRADGIYSEGDDPSLVLDNLKAAMNAVLDDADGKIRVTVLHNDLASPIGDLTTADVLGEFTWLQTPPLTDSVNVIRGGYVDPSPTSLYQLVDLPEVTIPSPDGIDRPQTVNLAFVQSPGQGQRLFKLRLGRAQYGGTYTAVFQATAWKYQKGDVIRFTFSPLGWDKKLFRIADVATQVDGTVPMMLREEHPAIYAAYSDERAAITAAAPTSYDPTLWPVIQGIVDAGTTAEWSGVAGPGKPADNATNSADPNSPFGSGTVGEAIAQLDRIEPISSDTADLKEAQKELDEAVDRLRQSDDAAVVALAALRGVVLDGAATQRQIQRAEGKLAAATMQLLLMSDSADARMRDAGFITDPATGKVYAYALDRLGDRQTKVEATLDAQAGEIALRATSSEVDEKILKAVLSPEQVAQLEPLIARIAAVEVVYDALKAEVQTKAELVELTKAVARITDAEQWMSAAEGLISSKVSQTSFDQAMVRIGAAEQLLQSYGDVSRYGIELRQDRAARAQSDQALLASILGEHQADELRLTAQALLRQELYTKIVDGDALEARARTEIALRVRDLDARSVQDRLLSIEGDRLLAQDIDALGVQTAQQSAEIATLQKATLAAGVGIAGVEQSIRQQVRSQSQADAALLGGVLATDKAEDRFITSLAEIHSQLTTTLVAGFQAEAVARQGLRARIDSADARFDQEARSTADRIRAVTELITSLGARFDDPATGLAATRADLSRVERVTAEAAQANVDAIAQLRAIVIDPVTGLEKTRATLTTLSELVATQNSASVRRLDLLEGTVNDPATGLPWARGAIADLARVTTSRDDAAAEAIRQVRAEVDGVGGVGLEEAFRAVVNRLGQIEGTITFKIDVNGNVTGLQLVGGGQGPGSLNLINTDLKMGTGRVVFNTGTFMKVQGVGFGAAKDLIEWYGPTMAIDQCSRANALEYRTTTGDAYYGGSLSTGTLRNGSASSSLASDAVAEVPSFGSNGKPVRYIASWSYYSQYTRDFAADDQGLRLFQQAVDAFSATSDDGGYVYFGTKNVERPASTITLSRAFAGAAYQQLAERSFTTEQTTFRGLKPTPGDAPGHVTYTESIGGGFTVLDPNQSTADRALRLALSRGFALSEGVIQRLTIVAIEE